QHPRTAGRSSLLFNTGTVAWLYRCLVEGLFGVKGDRHGLVLQPQLPSHWTRADVIRTFRGATFDIKLRREKGVSRLTVAVDGQALPGNRITNITTGKSYHVTVDIPC